MNVTDWLVAVGRGCQLVQELWEVVTALFGGVDLDHKCHLDLDAAVLQLSLARIRQV
jgi:hypothetical protein